MAQLTILRYPDPRLHTVARPVADVDERMRRLVDDMLETMYAVRRHRPGGHAGRRARARDRDGHLRAARPAAGADQPRDLWRSDEMAVNEEGCLSVPAIYDRVERPARVNVRALDRDGQPFELEAEGLTGGVRAARDGPPDGQGVRRIPEPAQARPHPHQDAEEDARRASVRWRPARAFARRAPSRV